MRLANVPPPMALHEITLGYNAVDVAVSGCVHEMFSDAVRIAVLGREVWSLYTWPLDAKGQKAPRRLVTHRLAMNATVLWTMNLQITCSREGAVVCLSSHAEMPVIWSFNHNAIGPGYLPQRGERIEGIVNPGYQPSHQKIYLMSDTNEAFGFEERDFYSGVKPVGIALSLFRSSHSGLLEATSWQREVHVPTNDQTNGVITPIVVDVVFSLSESGTLFANERRLVRNCTSFLVTPVLLIFTTSQHRLKFVHLVDDADGKHEIPLSMH